MLSTLRIQPQGDQHAVIAKHLAVDEHHPNVKLVQQNSCMRRLDSATNRRDTALLEVTCSATPLGSGSSVRRYLRVDTPAAIASIVCASIGSVAAAHWKLASPTSPWAVRTRRRGISTWRPPSVTRLGALPPRHARRSPRCLPAAPPAPARRRCCGTAPASWSSGSRSCPTPSRPGSG